MSGSAAPSSKREVPGSGSVEVVALLLLVEGVLLRSWIYVASPLPSDTPLAWFALGTAQDVAILAITGALALVAARGRGGWLWRCSPSSVSCSA